MAHGSLFSFGSEDLLGPNVWDICSDAFMVVDETGIIVDLNAACCALIGIDRLRLVGQQLDASFVLESSSSFYPARAQFVAVPVGSKHRLRFSEASYIVERLNYRCFRVETLAVASEEVPETVPLDVPDQSAYSRLRGHFDKRVDVPIPSFCVLASGRFIETNDEFERWIGSVSNSQTRGRIYLTLQEIVAEGQRKRVDELLLRASQRERGRGSEHGSDAFASHFHDDFETVFGTWISIRLRDAKLENIGLGKDRQAVLFGACIDISRHRQIEESLYSTEERFALAVSASLDGIWEWRIGSSEVYFSGRLAALLGYERSEFKNRLRHRNGVLSIVKKQDRLRFVKELRSHLRSRTLLDFEFRAHHRDQGIRWYRLRGQALWSNTSGSAIRVAGSLTDVTENRELRSHLQSQLDSIDGHAVLLTFDAEQILLQANERFLALSGFGIEEIRSKSFRQLITRGLTNVSKQGSRSNRLQGRSSDYGFRTRTGSERVVRGALSPLLDVDGHLQGYSFFGFDVSEKYLAERELASEIAFRKAVFDSAGSIIITTDPQGIVSTVNSYGMARFECSEDEVIGQKTPAVFFRSFAESHDGGSDQSQGVESHKPDVLARRGGFLLGLMGGLISGQILTREAQFCSRSGTVFPVLMSLSRVENSHREFIGYVIVAQDISELKRIEKLKSDFVSTVSHELRTPLTSISGALKVIDAMSESVSQAQASELIKMAIRNSDRLLFLINDLLDMQKIESGKMDFDFKEINLEDLIQFSISTMEAIARERNVTIEFGGPEAPAPESSVPDSPVYLHGDFDRLVQVMVNLISNAIKFAPEGSEVSVSLRRARGVVRVGVRDSGPGVPTNFQSRMFEKFSQADGSDSKSKGGTGLGLSICKAIITHHHGNIQFWSDPIRGTEFYFEIPENLADMLPDNAESRRQRVSSHSYNTRATILVVEDDPDIADLLSSMLEDSGFQTIQARTVEAARKVLAEETIDLVTLDLIMPDANGSVILDEMARSGKLENVPVLVISGYTERVDGGRFAPNARPKTSAKRTRSISDGHTGTNHFATLAKPVRAADLNRLVTQALSFRAKRVLLFVASSGGSRAASFLRGVCEHSVTVIEVSSVNEAVDFLSHHVAASLVLVDKVAEDIGALVDVLRRQPEQPRLIRWHLDDDPKSGLTEQGSGPVAESSLSATVHQTTSSEPVEYSGIIDIFGMHWGAAAQFQNLLSESGVLEAS
jgi:PAS domain S-box-containing protein